VRDPRVRQLLEDFDRPALHAEQLAFRHPTSNEPLSFTAPLPADLQKLLEGLEQASKLI
jgi:23S rRNA pseudouridine1911/1915/1917 synthase